MPRETGHDSRSREMHIITIHLSVYYVYYVWWIGRLAWETERRLLFFWSGSGKRYPVPIVICFTSLWDEEGVVSGHASHESVRGWLSYLYDFISVYDGDSIG